LIRLKSLVNRLSMVLMGDLYEYRLRFRVMDWIGLGLWHEKTWRPFQ